MIAKTFSKLIHPIQKLFVILNPDKNDIVKQKDYVEGKIVTYSYIELCALILTRKIW